MVAKKLKDLPYFISFPLVLRSFHRAAYGDDGLKDNKIKGLIKNKIK